MERQSGSMRRYGLLIFFILAVAALGIPSQAYAHGGVRVGIGLGVPFPGYVGPLAPVPPPPVFAYPPPVVVRPPAYYYSRYPYYYPYYRNYPWGWDRGYYWRGRPYWRGYYR